MRFAEVFLAWSFVIGGGVIAAAMVAIGMLELLPAIMRSTRNGRVHW